MIRSLFAATGFLILCSCATYPSKLVPAKTNIVQGKCDTALHLLEDLSNPPGDDRLLYLMEYGSALQICRDYVKSNQVFQTADALSEQLDYHSVSRVLGATLFNEEVIQYKGDKFEKIFINALSALNYLQLDRLDDAMVEVRRINEKFLRFSAEEKKSFELNSFSKYLSGLVWEVGKKYDDACIDYKEAYHLDKNFRAVGLDMLTACWRARRTQEFNSLAAEMNASDSEVAFAKRKYKKEIILVYLQGWGPQKATRRNDAVFPYLVPTPSQTKKLGVEWIGQKGEKQFRKSDLVYNVERAAIATLEADYNSLAGRRMGARVAKEVIADQIRQKDKTLGNIAWLVMVASEHADLRNWTFLPETVQVLRVDADNAEKLSLLGYNSGDSVTENFEDIDLMAHANKKIYLVRSIK